MAIKKGKYMHYKGILCDVIGVGRHSETLEEFVVYIHDSKDYGKNSIWMRPKKIFLETVNLNGKEVPRFKFIE